MKSRSSARDSARVGSRVESAVTARLLIDLPPLRIALRKALARRRPGASVDLPIPGSVDQPVLHREDGGGGPARDADLVVDVLDVVLGGPRRDLEPSRRSRGSRAPSRPPGAPRPRARSGRRAGWRSTEAEAGRRPRRRPRRHPRRAARRRRPREVDPTRPREPGPPDKHDPGSSPATRPRRPGPGRPATARAPPNRGGTRSRRVARDAFRRSWPPAGARTIGPGSARSGRRGAGPAPTAPRERTGPLPDLVGDPDAPDVVQPRGDFEPGGDGTVETQAATGCPCEFGDAARVPEGVRRLQIGDVAEHGRDVAQPRRRYVSRPAWARRPAWPGGDRRRALREDGPGVRDERVGHRRVEHALPRAA